MFISIILYSTKKRQEIEKIMFSSGKKLLIYQHSCQSRCCRADGKTYGMNGLKSPSQTSQQPYE